MTHYYTWKNNKKRLSLYHRSCRILAYLKMNSIVIEFENGQQEVTSRYAVRLQDNNKQGRLYDKRDKISSMDK
jgi:hypothetical protein